MNILTNTLPFSSPFIAYIPFILISIIAFFFNHVFRFYVLSVFSSRSPLSTFPFSATSLLLSHFHLYPGFLRRSNSFCLSFLPSNASTSLPFLHAPYISSPPLSTGIYLSLLIIEIEHISNIHAFKFPNNSE